MASLVHTSPPHGPLARVSSVSQTSKKRHRRRTSPSIIAILRQGFEYEVFRDLHDHLFERFERPGVILTIRDAEDHTLRPCFPRKRSPLPPELFHHVTAVTAKSPSQNLIVSSETKVARDLLQRERTGSPSPWGWTSSQRGLIDLYLPIRTTDGYGRADDIAGVLVFGKYRIRGTDSIGVIRKWVSEITAGPKSKDYLPDCSPGERAKLEADLHKLADQVPVLDDATRRLVEYEVRRSLSLTQRFLTRTLTSGMLFGGEDLIDKLITDEPTLGISLADIWSTLEGHLYHITQALRLECAVAYVAEDRDYTELRQVAAAGLQTNTSHTLSFPSEDEFRWVENQNWVNLPRHREPLAWLTPLTLLSARNATLFAHEFPAGYLVLLAFGVNNRRRLTPSERTTLYDAVNTRVFRFLEAALSAVELDELMAETGHLMGRAVGKVQSGFEVLQELLPTVLPQSQRTRRYQLACWALEDGATRLDLIRQNFYAFAGQRRQVDAEKIFDPAFSEDFDVIAILRGMRSFFDRTAEENEFKPISYEFDKEPLVVRGHLESLRLTFLNLFDNAVKFSYSNTYIKISAVRESSRAVIAFENLGVGVAPDEVERVFRRLRRSRFRDPSRRIEGLGLGLPYCKRVVELIFGGTITLRSWEAETRHRRFQGDNWLTEVTLELPLVR